MEKSTVVFSRRLGQKVEAVAEFEDLILEWIGAGPSQPGSAGGDFDLDCNTRDVVNEGFHR